MEKCRHFSQNLMSASPLQVCQLSPQKLRSFYLTRRSHYVKRMLFGLLLYWLWCSIDPVIAVRTSQDPFLGPEHSEQTAYQMGSSLISIPPVVKNWLQIGLLKPHFNSRLMSLSD